jgi:hypothetical protein
VLGAVCIASGILMLLVCFATVSPEPSPAYCLPGWTAPPLQPGEVPSSFTCPQHLVQPWTFSRRMLAVGAGGLVLLVVGGWVFMRDD